MSPETKSACLSTSEADFFDFYRAKRVSILSDRINEQCFINFPSYANSFNMCDIKMIEHVKEGRNSTVKAGRLTRELSGWLPYDITCRCPHKLPKKGISQPQKQTYYSFYRKAFILLRGGRTNDKNYD